MLVRASVLAFPSAELMAEKAALEGAKMVTSSNESTVETRFAADRAPAMDVRFAANAVPEGDCGTVRTVSITWITPPVKFRFWFHEHGFKWVWEYLTAVTTDDCESNPDVIATPVPFSAASMTWPPVTLVKLVFDNSVGMNCDAFVNAEAGYVPFRT